MGPAPTTSLGLAVPVLALVAAAALVQPEPALAETAVVSIVDFGFAPATVQVRITAGEPAFPAPHAHVDWTNTGQVVHNVTFDGAGLPSSPNLQPGQLHAAVFEAPGTFSYRCSIHPSMTGSVVVLPLESTTSTTTPITTTTAPPTTTTTASTSIPAPTGPQPSAAPSTVAPRAATTKPPATSTVPAPSTSSTHEATTTTVTSAVSTSTTTDSGPPGATVLAQNQTDDGGSGPPWLLLAVLAVAGGAGALAVARTVRRRSDAES